jgi:ribose transport system ATP-binding protein
MERRIEMVENAENLLELKNISKSFSGIPVLKNIDLDVQAGEIHVLLGENGAGKSTLIKIMTGAYHKDEGEMYWQGKEVAIHEPSDALNLGIATIYQELNLIPELTVYENMFLGREMKKGGKYSFVDRKRMSDEARAYLQILKQDISPSAKISSLGIGKQQLVEIAKALTMDAKLIIMDEPTSSLSSTETEELLKTIVELRDRGIAIIYISHRLEEVKKIGDRLTILRDGTKIDTMPVGEMSTDQMIQLMVGRTLEAKYPKETFELGQEGLQVKNLRLKDSTKTIDFSAFQGQILGISGLVGSGRTEIAKAIFGVDPIDSGEFYVFGKKVNIHSPKDAIQAGLAFITEDRKGEGLILDQTLEFNTTIADLSKFRKGLFIQLKQMRQKAKEYINELRVRPNDINKHARHLSGGNQQKVVIAKWLATKGKIFIFDEPTRGIDVAAKVEVYRLINDLVKNGVVVIIISSELPEILGICDRILVMHEGEIAADFLQDAANQEKIMKAATGGV